MAEVRVVGDRSGGRVEALVDGVVAGFSSYVEAPGQRVFLHTEVDQAYEGHGVGSALARGSLDRARADGLDVVPLCPFIREWIDKHPDYADLVAPLSPEAARLLRQKVAEDGHEGA